MELTPYQQSLLNGDQGAACQKSMRILYALGTIYNAARLIPISSVQVAGVSYDNLGEAGLEFLSELADQGGRVQVLTTLNPAGMDVENWQALGIDPQFAAQQQRVLDAFARMGILTTCSCTPYLFGNLPRFGEHIAWAESSAVCYANSVLGARTNREGGPSALAAALTGYTPEYGMHLDANRIPGVHVQVTAPLSSAADFGALGRVIGEKLEGHGQKPIPFITGIQTASMENLKSLAASIATYGGLAMFHMQGITPEAGLHTPPTEGFEVGLQELAQAWGAFNDATPDEIDFVSLGCPHLSIAEIARLATLLEGRTVHKTFWVTTSRPVKQMADRAGYTQIIENSGAVIAADTCCVVAPIGRRFHALLTDSAKAGYYAGAKHKFKTRFLPFDQVVEEACR